MRNNLRYFIVLFLCLVSYSLFGQTTGIDSLKRELNKKHPDTTFVSIYLSLSAESIYYDFKKAKPYADSALQYSLKTNKYQIAQVYNNLGLIEHENGEPELARMFYDKALKELDENDDKKVRGIVYGNYSVTYDNSNNFDKELEYSLKAIELNSGDDFELSFLYYNHSVIYEDAGFNNESVYYLELAREMASRSEELRVESYASMNLAYHAMREKEYSKAENYLVRVGEICQETNSLEVCHYYYLTLGRLQTLQEKYNEAEVSILKSKDLAIQRNLESKIVESYLMLGNLEFEKGNYAEAAHIYDTKNIDSFEVINLWYADLKYKKRALLESKLGNHKKSNELLYNYLTYADSIHKSENRSLLTNADRKYKIEKKNKEIAEQQLELKEQETEIQKQDSQIIYMTGLALFLLVAGLLTWLVYQQKQKRKNQEILTLKREYQIKSLESLIEGEEKERFRIAKELHDGINGDLSAIKYKLSSLLEMNNKVIKEAITMIDDSCEQVRAISHNLMPPSLENFNLVEATENYCDSINAVNKESVTFQFIGEDIQISKKAEVNAFRIIQELISNALKHAQAGEINVQLSNREGVVQITVEDDGKGFDQNNIESQGIGLSNIQSRADYLNAEIDLISNAQGTSCTIDIDLNKLNDN
nr:sensor histidine kinase [uncultured Psychroserpens sp.]